jgi:4-carboxymuconolactone decarboxylase
MVKPTEYRGHRMARVPVLKSPEELTGEARRIAEKIVDTRKSLEGPFSVWMHAPEWAERVAHLGTMVRWEGTLELRVRTLAALVVGRHFQAQYVWGIQGVIGAERGVPRATIDAIREDRSDGIPPEDLQIIDFTRQLLRKNRVDEALAQAVMARFGADQYVQLTTCIGYYAMLAMTVNGVELEPNPKHEALDV